MRWRVLACSLALTLACAASPVFAAAPANQAEWSQAVQRRMISSFIFPPEARRLDGPISLSLKIIVLRDGSIADISIDRSSGDAAVWQAQVKAAERRQRQRRASIELYDHYLLAGRQGIDYVVAPGAGPGHADTLEYYAELPLPQGRIRLACATQRDAMPAALTMFRQVRDGIRIAPRSP